MAAKPYLQLVRLPNLFTAAADSLAGWLLVGGALARPGGWLPLVIASVCTYAGGVVLNDVFDVEVDRAERPGRPLPSGRVGVRTAAVLGAGLLGLGLVAAVASGTSRAWVVEGALIGCVLAYDAGLKRSALGPEVMGACRGLNFLLGASASAHLGGPVVWVVAVSYAGFVAGVTWISRSEAAAAFRREIAVGIALQNAAVAGLLLACLFRDRFPSPTRASQGEFALGGLLLAALIVAIDRQTLPALESPQPVPVQRAVKFGILSLVWLHVGVVLAARGYGPALAVAALWVPAVFVGRWIYST